MMLHLMKYQLCGLSLPEDKSYSQKNKLYNNLQLIDTLTKHLHQPSHISDHFLARKKDADFGRTTIFILLHLCIQCVQSPKGIVSGHNRALFLMIFCWDIKIHDRNTFTFSKSLLGAVCLPETSLNSLLDSPFKFYISTCCSLVSEAKQVKLILTAM